MPGTGGTASETCSGGWSSDELGLAAEKRLAGLAPCAPVAYYDWCFGNGIFDSAGASRLTKANCAPLFARPPVTFGSGQMIVVDGCGPLATG